MNVRRNARKQGYAWAESGRSEYDVIATVDWCTLKIPSTITPEFLSRKAGLTTKPKKLKEKIGLKRAGSGKRSATVSAW
jgi:hypothetical protein